MCRCSRIEGGKSSLRCMQLLFYPLKRYIHVFRIYLFLADLLKFFGFAKISRQKEKRRNMDGMLILYSQRITYSLKAPLMSYCINHHLLLISHLILKKQENCCLRYNLKLKKSKYLSDERERERERDNKIQISTK